MPRCPECDAPLAPLSDEAQEKVCGVCGAVFSLTEALYDETDLGESHEEDFLPFTDWEDQEVSLEEIL